MTEGEYRDRVRSELAAPRMSPRPDFATSSVLSSILTSGAPDTLGEATLSTSISVVALAAGNYHPDQWDASNANVAAWIC